MDTPETTVQRSDEDQINDIVEHKEFVYDNCMKLSKWLRDNGNLEMSIRLIVEGFTHDLDKFNGIQWLYMRKNAPPSDQLSLAVEEHAKTNRHHPEYWKNIHEMEDLDLMVMACDWVARSQQFCTDVRQWIKNVDMERYGFTEKDAVYMKLQTYLDVIMDKPFQTVAVFEEPKKPRRKSLAKSA